MSPVGGMWLVVGRPTGPRIEQFPRRDSPLLGVNRPIKEKSLPINKLAWEVLLLLFRGTIVESALPPGVPTMAEQVQSIEFVGGPLDGHQYEPRGSVEHVWRLLFLPINTRLLRLLVGEGKEPRQRVTSVAIYDLVRRPTVWQYRHVCTTAPEMFEFHGVQV